MDATFKKPVEIEGKVYTHYAYYSDNPELQGYGVNQSSARLDLFKKQKDAESK